MSTGVPSSDGQAPGLYRMLAVSPLLSAATAYRAGVAHTNVWYKNASALWNMWFDAIEPGPGQVKAAGDLRQTVLDLMEDSSKAVSKELDRGISDIREYGKRPTAAPSIVRASPPPGQAEAGQA